MLQFIRSKTHPNLFFINAESLQDKIDLGALLSRYSRSDKDAETLYKEEFLTNPNRGSEFYAKVFGQYGDESIAELVPHGFAVCLENIPVLWATRLLHYRMLSAIEKSTRYVKALDYYKWDGAKDSYINKCDKMMQKFEINYKHAYETLKKDYNLDTANDNKAFHRALHAKALDYSRHLLPLSTLTSLGIVANLRSWLNILPKEHWRGRYDNLYQESLIWPLIQLFEEHFPTIFSYDKVNKLWQDEEAIQLGRVILSTEVDEIYSIYGNPKPITSHEYLLLDCSPKSRINEVIKPLLYIGGRAKKQKPLKQAELIDFTIYVPKVDIATFRDIQRHRFFSIFINNDPKPDLDKSMAQYISIIMKGNLREWTHAIELRTQEQGHYNYREVFQNCAQLIANEIGLPKERVFPYADWRTDSEIGLGRLKAEVKKEENLK